MRYGEKTREQVRGSLKDLSPSEHHKKVLEWSAKLGVSEKTVYNWASKGSLRQPRSDRGSRRVSVSDEALDWMYKQTINYGYPAHEVVARAEAAGKIAPHAIHHTTYARWVKRDRVRPGVDLTPNTNFKGLEARSRLKKQPHRRFEAKQPNRIHQVDATELKPYYIQEDGKSVGFEASLGPNRENNGRPRIHLFSMVDDCSRCLCAKIYTSKDADVWIDFLFYAWSGGKAESPLRGRPKLLYGDKDSATEAGTFKRFAHEMAFTYEHHKPGNPGAKGKIEKGGIAYLKGAIQRDLLVMLDQQKPVNLDLANEMLAEIVARKNARTHGTTGRIPADHYTAEVGTVRDMPPVSDLYHYFWEDITVLLRTDLTVRIDNVYYQVPRKEPFLSHFGQKIVVWADRKKQHRTKLGIEIERKVHIIDAVQAVPDEPGVYKSLPKTRQEKIIERAYDVDMSDFDPRQISQSSAPQAPPNITPLVTPFAPEKEAVMITHTGAKVRMVREGVGAERVGEIFGSEDAIGEDVFEARLARLKNQAQGGI